LALYGSINIIQKEIDTIKRASYVEQINIFEKMFKIETLKKFPNWCKYVEITQRRNIITHNDGIINDQYINVCTNNNVLGIGDMGEKLNISYDYLVEAISIIEEVSIKLTQILWRKCFPGEGFSYEFDIILNQTIFSFLEAEEWILAKVLGEFACTIIKPASNEFKMMYLINYCIALNMQEERTTVHNLLDRVDFSTMSHEFLLAKYILLDDIDNAIKTMTDIGCKGKYFNKRTYPIFPLFYEIRHDQRFKDTYIFLFGEDIDQEEINVRIDEVEGNEKMNIEITNSKRNFLLCD